MKINFTIEKPLTLFLLNYIHRCDRKYATTQRSSSHEIILEWLIFQLLSRHFVCIISFQMCSMSSRAGKPPGWWMVSYRCAE